MATLLFTNHLQIAFEVIFKIYLIFLDNKVSKGTLKMAAATATSAKKPKHWSHSLVTYMKDPEAIVKKADGIVVIKDMYPKAKIHYLVLPEDNINDIYKLDSSHLNLLEKFGEIYEELKAEHKGFTLRAGFHAIPSMIRMHMHIISTDMISPCLKTKIHWNSFTTKFFLPYQGKLIEIVA